MREERERESESERERERERAREREREGERKGESYSAIAYPNSPLSVSLCLCLVSIFRYHKYTFLKIFELYTHSLTCEESMMMRSTPASTSAAQRSLSLGRVPAFVEPINQPIKQPTNE